MFSPKLLYAAAIFLSSCLLFLVEPMAAKRLLPLLGGSAAVWTTCLVFFQTTLLLGYMSAHGLATRMRPRKQALAYIVLLALCLWQVGHAIHPDLHARPEHPIISVLWLLTMLIGMPFLALSATGPLLQSWYVLAGKNHPDQTAQQPYRLFALSNFASLLALVIYPWLIEPRFSLHTQNVAWAVGFLLLVLVAVLIGGQAQRFQPEVPQNAVDLPSEGRPNPTDRVLWLLLPACGSLLLSAVTNHLSQNVAAIPLLWIIPLVMYLLSFVVAFNGERFCPRWLTWILFPLALCSVGYLLYEFELRVSFKLSIIVFCLALFLICLYCHSELHRRRPAPRYLTAFYLLIAAGGALGAIFVGVLVPVTFSGNYELACGLLFAAVMGLLVSWKHGRWWWIWCIWWIFWTAAIVAAGYLVHYQIKNDRMDTMLQTRSFYGTLSVTQTIGQGGRMTRTLYHGTIEHGSQIYTVQLRMWPTSYYAHNSGVGLALDLCCGTRLRRVGIIGLGTGTLAAYGRKGDIFRFYEINPAVEPIARNLFTYLRETPAKVEIVPGDARLSLASEPPQQYDVLVIDAFSGDAIPVHLLTSQALELYRRHLQPNGIMAFHVSNQFLELAPEVRQQAEHAGLQAVFLDSPEDLDKGEYSSDWVLVTANEEFLAQSQVTDAQKDIDMPAGLRLWTDDYNSLLPLLKKQPWLKKGDDEDQSEDNK